MIPALAQRYGGPSSVIGPLCRALNSLPGLEVELATTNADGPGKTIERDKIPSDFPVHVFPRKLSERWQYSPGLGSWLTCHVREYDLIHTHALWAYAAGAAGRAARKAGVPYIVRPAGMLSGYSLAQRAWKKNLYWWLLESHTVKHATAFHVTSEEEGQEIRRFAGTARIAIVPNGVEASAWSSIVDRESLRPLGSADAPALPVILFLSRLHPKKGLADLLLPAFARMKCKATLVIAGGPDDRAPGFETEVCRAVGNLKLQQRVVLLGWVDGNRRWALFDAADVFVLPSHSENFGIVVAEAMARGCPVVVTEAVQSSSHVIAAGAGEVVPRDVSALATALDRILADSDLRRRCGEAGRKYAERHFRWEPIAQQVRQLYEDCLKERRATRTGGGIEGNKL